MLKSYDLNIVKDIEFPDHYKYSKNDIEKIILDSKNQGYKIITTEKDFLRLQPKNYNEINFIKSKLEIQNETEFLQSLTKII
jgi:tetraacyldisaccharide 4'-kinase